MGSESLAMSSDGNHIYVAAIKEAAVSWFSRNPVSGVLSYVGNLNLLRDGLDSLKTAFQ